MTHRLGSSLLLCLLAGTLAAATAGCKTGSAGTVPTSIPVATFSAPDEEELFPEEEEAEDAAPAREGE